MTLAPIVCENCGAKYRLPETFKSPKAKCKKCGSMIDVAGQRSAPAEPAAASAAPDKPARTASTRSRRESSRSSGEEAGGPRASRSGRSGRSGSSSRRSGGRSGGRRGRGGEETEKKKGKGMLIGVGVLVLAAAGGGAFVLLGGPSEAELAAQQAAEEQAAAEQAATEQAAALVTAIQAALDQSAEGVADPDQASTELAGFQSQLDEVSAMSAAAAEEATALFATFKDRVDQAVAAKAAADKADAEAAAAEAAARQAAAPPPQAAAETGEQEEKWTSYVINDPSEVFDPMTETEPAPWPDYVTEEERAEIESLIADVARGGRASFAAKTKLEEYGHKALAAMVNRLREVNYTDSFDTMFAYEMNKMLERVTVTINAGFQDVVLGEEVDLRIAHWNASTVKAWLRLCDRYPTKEDWDRLMKSRARGDR